MFAQGLLEHFSNRSFCELVVVYEDKIKEKEFEDDHSHEEADTLIPHEVLTSIAASDWREVFVWSPDTCFSLTWSLVIALVLKIVA